MCYQEVNLVVPIDLWYYSCYFCPGILVCWAGHGNQCLESMHSGVGVLKRLFCTHGLMGGRETIPNACHWKVEQTRLEPDRELRPNQNPLITHATPVMPLRSIAALGQASASCPKQRPRPVDFGQRLVQSNAWKKWDNLTFKMKASSTERNILISEVNHMSWNGSRMKGLVDGCVLLFGCYLT